MVGGKVCEDAGVKDRSRRRAPVSAPATKLPTQPRDSPTVTISRRAFCRVTASGVVLAVRDCLPSPVSMPFVPIYPHRTPCGIQNVREQQCRCCLCLLFPVMPMTASSREGSSRVRAGKRRKRRVRVGNRARFPRRAGRGSGCSATNRRQPRAVSLRAQRSCPSACAPRMQTNTDVRVCGFQCLIRSSGGSGLPAREAMRQMVMGQISFSAEKKAGKPIGLLAAFHESCGMPERRESRRKPIGSRACPSGAGKVRCNPTPTLRIRAQAVTSATLRKASMSGASPRLTAP